MACIHCAQPVAADSLCNIHWHHREWQDNRDIDNLGIVKFAKAVVPHWARDEFATLHKEVLWNFFRMYSKSRTNKYDRLLNEIAFRGAAKTTGAKLILLYVCCFGTEKFVVYCSETSTFATNDVFDVRKELTQNELIRSYFGSISSKEISGQSGEWNKNAYRTSTGVNVLARGVGQQIRSALKDSWRPTLAIINDMYSKDSVKTEYTRENYKTWFNNDLMNAIDDIDGKVFFNGTILHEDTVPVMLEKNKHWKTLKYPIMNMDEFQTVLSLCQVSDAGVIPPDNLPELEKLYPTAWFQRLSLKYILLKYSEAHANQAVDHFYQEYFHVVVPPGERNFGNLQIFPMTYFRDYGQNWLRVKYTESHEVVYPVNIMLGVDPASSNTAFSKYSVIFIMMMNQFRQVFYYGYSRGKYGLRDEFLPEHSNRSDGDLVELDESKLKRKGIVDEVIRIAKRYWVNGSQVETTQAQEHIYTDISRLMRKNNAMHRLYSEKPHTKKEDRDADMLIPDFQSGSAFVNTGLADLVRELGSFPRGSTIDIVDAAYHARRLLTPSDDHDFEKVKALYQENGIGSAGYIKDFHLL